MRYALVRQNTVTNIIWLYPGNARDFPGAAAIGSLPVAVGDEYRDGTFLRGGVPLETLLEDEDDGG